MAIAIAPSPRACSVQVRFWHLIRRDATLKTRLWIVFSESESSRGRSTERRCPVRWIPPRALHAMPHCSLQSKFLILPSNSYRARWALLAWLMYQLCCSEIRIVGRR